MERGDNTLLFVKLASHSVSVLVSGKERNLRKMQLFQDQMQNLVYLMILSQGSIRCSFLSKTKCAYQNISSDLQLLQLYQIKAGKKCFLSEQESTC